MDARGLLDDFLRSSYADLLEYQKIVLITQATKRTGLSITCLDVIDRVRRLVGNAHYQQFHPYVVFEGGVTYTEDFCGNHMRHNDQPRHLLEAVTRANIGLIDITGITPATRQQELKDRIVAVLSTHVDKK